MIKREIQITFAVFFLIMVVGLLLLKATYDQGYNNGFNDASFEWCNLFNDLGDFTNMLLNDLQELDYKAKIIPKLNLLECKK
jgi:hypothetical protein